jgi:hypothetical protein
MDVRTIVTARSWAEGHQILSMATMKSGGIRAGFESRPTKVVGRRSSSIVFVPYLSGCRNCRPNLATTSQPDRYPSLEVGSGLVDVIQPLASSADAARCSSSSGTRMSSRYKVSRSGNIITELRQGELTKSPVRILQRNIACSPQRIPRTPPFLRMRPMSGRGSNMTGATVKE